MIYINNTPITNYKNLENFEEVSGILTLSFTSFSMANNAHRYLNEEAIVTIAGYDFKIKRMTGTTFSKSIQAVSTFFDLGGHYIDDMFAGTRKLSELLDFTFKDTSWTYELDAPDDRLFMPNYGNDNALKLLNALLQVAKLEYQILPNQRVRIAKQIGPDNGAQYRYGYNIKTLSRVVDTTNLKTRIRGYGADGLSVIYTSPNASKFGIIEADPVHDDRFYIKDNLVDYIKSQLNDEPEISIELDTVELTNKSLGERVWLIYEPLDIEIKSRILSKRSVIRNGELVTESVVIGNSLPKSTSDLFAEQKLEYDTQNKVNRSKFEQTNDRITLEVEELEVGLQANRAALDVTAKEIRAEVEEKITVTEENLEHVKSQVEALNTDLVEKINAVDIKAISNTSHLSQLATSLTSKIETEITRVDNKVDNFSSEFRQTSSSLSSTISSNYNTLQGRINQSNSAINQWADRINLKVDKGGVISAINLSPESVDISASKINFNGHVFGSNATFTGTIRGSAIRGGRYYGADGSSDKIDFGSGYISLSGDGIRLARNSSNYLSVDSSGHFFFYGSSGISARINTKSSGGGHLTINEITVTNFNNSSAREMKKNIKKASFNGLKKVMSTPIYQYHFKTQDDRELMHTGTIYDESPPEMVSPHGDAISPYAMTSVLWKAVQELNQKVEELAK